MRREKIAETGKSGAAAGPQITRILEPGTTAFSAAEIRVAVAPVGELEPDILQRYYELISKHRMIELQSIQPFYTAQQKSPFKAFPWKQGSIHLRFLPEDTALKASPLNCLHTHRNVLGVIGICHCPTNPDLGEAYATFEALARKFPGAMALRCFAFQPSDEQVASENEKKQKSSNLTMFPPTEGDEVDQLENHAKFLLLDFAAGVLGEIERWMLTASPNMIDMNTFADISEKFLGPNSLLNDMRGRFPAATDEENTRKKRYGRMQKAMGDFSLLAGSPTDAADHYGAAIELARNSMDHIWLAASFIGLANAKTMQHCLEIGEDTAPTQGDNSELSELSASKQRKAKMRAASQVSATSGTMGPEFWESLKHSSLEAEVKPLYADAKNVLYGKRGGPVLQVEADLQLARLLAGLHSHQARREVSERASQIQEAGVQLLLPEDRLYAMMEAAQVLGLVGSGRKRILILWQAVEASRALGISNDKTLQIARKALEPPDDPRESEEESELLAKAKPLQSSVPQHWSSVRAACIEGVLSTAILASRHADVWDAAALLLREHYRDVSLSRQEGLIRTLQAAASKMLPAQFKREGSGPPPLISFTRAVPLPPHLLPRLLSSNKKAVSGSTDSKSPFLYNPLEAKDKADANNTDKPAALWVAGETATVEIEIWNPTAQTIKVERVTIDAANSGDPSVALIDQNSSPPAWKPFAFAMNIPPNAPPSKVPLTGIPYKKGLYTVTGCTVTWNNISWQQPWTFLPGKHAFLGSKAPRGDAGGLARARVKVAEPLPFLNARLLQKKSNFEDAELFSGEEHDKPPVPLALVAIRGQVLELQVAIKNTGKMNVTHAAILADHHAVKSESGERSYEVRPPQNDGNMNIKPSKNAKQNPMQIELAESILQHQLPVKNGAQFNVPILIHSSESAMFGNDEDWVLDFRIEYYTQRADMSGGDEDGEEPKDPIGRILRFPLSLRFTASLQINSVYMFEHHEAPLQGELGSHARRRCVMELDISNKANALQVWVAQKQVPGLDSQEWKKAVSHPRPWEKGGAAKEGRPSSLACRIAVSQGSIKVAAFVDDVVARLDDANQISDVSRQAVLARALAGSFAVYWRREEDLSNTGAAMDVGCLSIPIELIEQALDQEAQQLLLPKPLQACFSQWNPSSTANGSIPNGVIKPADVFREELLHLRHDEMAANETKDTTARPGAIWGLKTKVGQPLQLSLQVINGSAADSTVSTSVSCHSAEVNADSSRQIDDPNVMPAGVVNRFKLHAKQNSTVEHRFGLCFLLPGLYVLYLHSPTLRSSQKQDSSEADAKSKLKQHDPQISVRTSYIHVE